MAERFSAKQLFKAAFDFMQENEIKLGKEEVVENPNLVLAFMEEYGVKLAAMKEELALQERKLYEKELLLECCQPNMAYSDSFDYDEEDWQVYDSLEEVEDEDHGGEEGDNSQEGDDGKEEEEKVKIIFIC